MSIQVKTPDGNIAQFPDGMSDTDIAAVLAKEFPAPKAAPAPPQPNTYSDIIKSAATGLAKAPGYLAGIGGDLANAGSALAEKGVGALGMDTKGASGFAHLLLNPLGAPTSEAINDKVGTAVGGFHKPQTTPGRYAETIASFAPAALAPGGLMARAARTVVPAATSEGAGELAQDAGLTPGWQTAARVAGALVGGRVATGALRSINAVSVGKGGPALIDPNEIASAKMRAAVASDGGPEAIGRNSANWVDSGASGPTLVDVGGNNVRRLVRASASGGTGEAQNVATTYADKVRANFQPTVLSHTRDLTPANPDSAVAMGRQLEADQGSVADQQYAAPYKQPAQVTPEMVSALQGPEGRGAIGRAYAAARANRNADQMAQLKDLQDVASEQGGGRDPITGRVRSVAQALAELPSGTLDRVRIAMRDTGIALAKNDKRDIAGGYFGRVKDIDTALDQTPGLQGARGTYRQMQAERDALDVGGTALNTGASDYASQISDLAGKGGPPNLGRSLQVGHRQALVDKLSAQTGGATGAARNIATSDQDTQNLAASFGATKGARYQAALGNEAKRVGNADFISPNTGSQTELRGQDTASLISKVPHSIYDLAIRVVDTVRGHGAPLTEAERAAVVRMGTTEADLRNLVRRNPNLNRAAIAQIAASNSSQRN